MTMTQTLHRPVPGYDDLYAGIYATIVHAEAGVLEQKIRDRYFSVRVPGLGIRNVHNLMAAAYLGPKPAGEFVRHGEAGRLDNRPGNLCYGTNSDNQHDSVEAGTHRNTSKTKCSQGHDYTPENTYVRPGTTHRQCRKCRYDSNANVSQTGMSGKHLSSEKKAKIRLLLFSSMNLSNRAIANAVGVSPQAVARQKASIATQLEK